MILVKEINGDSGDTISENEICLAHSLNMGGKYFKSYDGNLILFDQNDIENVESELGIEMDGSITLIDYIFNSLIDYEVLKYDNGLTITKEDCFNAIDDYSKLENEIYKLDSLEEIKSYLGTLLNDHIIIAFDKLVEKIRKQVKVSRFS